VLGCCHHLWVLVCGVVLSHVHHSWGGAGSGSLSTPLVGWCWAVVVVHGCCFVGGGAGPCSPFVGWCWAWVLIADAGGGDGPSSWWVVVGPHAVA